MPGWYKTGTVDTTADSAAIVGTGTAATINFSAGDIFLCSGEMHEVLSVTDDTHWTLATNFGTTENDVAYAVIRNFTGTTNATLAYKLTELLNSWQLREDEFENWIGGTENGGTGNDGKYPLTDAIGNTQLVECPAKIAALAVAVSSGVISWGSVTDKPTFGTAAAKNVGTASTDVAAGNVVTLHNADTTNSHLSAAQKTVATQAASAGANGFLTATDWATFNGKEPAITAGTASQYLKGNKTLGNFATDALVAAPAETATSLGTVVNAATAKTTPVDADMFGLMDSAGSNVLKKLSWANLITAITTALSSVFVAKTQTINAQTGTTYTLVLTDSSKLVTLSNAAAIALTVPTNASVAFPVGTSVDLAQVGAGQVTFAGDTGVTVNATPGLKLRAQYSGATLVKTATDTWLLVGDLSA